MTEISDANATGAVAWVLDEEDLGWLTEAILGASEIVVDLETTGLDEYAVEGGSKNGGVGARISLASFTLPQAEIGSRDRRWDGEEPVTWVLPCSHPDSPWCGKWRRVLRDLLAPAARAKIPFVNQNIKFDARWLYSPVVGVCVDISDLITWDTKDGQHLLDENNSTKLKVAVPQIFDVPAWNDFELNAPGASERVPLLDLGAYAARDTWWTWRWEQWQRGRMYLGDIDEPPFTDEDVQDAKLGRVATWVSMPTVASLTKIEQRGIRVDLPWVREHLQENLDTASKSLDWIADHFGKDRRKATTAATAGWFKEVVADALEAGELSVMALTPNGAPQWNAEVLEKQARRGSEVASRILAERKATKLSQFLAAWLASAGPDGAIHASYNSGSVLTGRLSSSNPNMQQVTKSLRPAFIPRDGYYIADFDFSQIELRGAAFVSRCEPMIRAFQEGADLHRRFASIVNQITEDEVSKVQRQSAKAGNFGLLYGMKAAGFQAYAEKQYGVVLTMEESLRIYNAFFETWDGMLQWHERVKAQVHRDGFVTSPLGRVRRLPEIWDSNDRMVSDAERAAINSPVQSFGSDLLQIAMASMQGLMEGLVDLPHIEGAFPVGTVHDSIVVELDQRRWQDAAFEVQERMQSLDRVLAQMNVDLDVPIVADFSVGTRWSLSDVYDSEHPETAPAVLTSAGGR